MQVSALHHVRLSERPVDREFKSHRPHVLKTSFLCFTKLSKKVLFGFLKDHYHVSAVCVLCSALFGEAEVSEAGCEGFGCVLS